MAASAPRRTRIGRSLSADIRFDDATGSRRHALVVNQADGVRVLDDRSPERVSEAIEQLVQQKLASGQLDDAPLTLRDLDRIKREFARVMSGTYHKRIGYPRASGGVASELQTAERE